MAIHLDTQKIKSCFWKEELLHTFTGGMFMEKAELDISKVRRYIKQINDKPRERN